ncbi:hypothetical protein C7S20_15835 [Christiangramia fulva]|uniref:Uncharacterized protein n=1 Tax=Christiangramia fulva TaxID=2126553 RepID=A0A2R3Z8L6_9FLAO|nr:hypothetical protein [Christiangramia fulva]AVR46613.1 hypothetical protein C7S20_15835 [Christiangramia fulva]
MSKKNYLGQKVLINYNKWVADREYQKLISEKLKLNFSDEGIYESVKIWSFLYRNTNLNPFG